MFKSILLQPRKFFRKHKQKKRSVLKWRYQSFLNYGDCGIKVVRPLRMSSQQIFRMKILLKKAIKKSESTRRYIWFNTFPHLPLTKKAKGMRMGKGVGKLNTWHMHLKGGSFVLEFKNLRFGRSIYFFKKVKIKLAMPTIIFFKKLPYLQYIGQRRCTFRVRGFW